MGETCNVCGEDFDGSEYKDPTGNLSHLACIEENWPDFHLEDYYS